MHTLLCASKICKLTLLFLDIVFPCALCIRLVVGRRCLPVFAAKLLTVNTGIIK